MVRGARLIGIWATRQLLLRFREMFEGCNGFSEYVSEFGHA